MALMVLGPFALLSGLLPLLRRSPDARVIAVTSGGMYAQSLDVSDLDGSKVEYGGPRFYARAKRAQVAIVREWARRLRGSSISFVSMHPGWARTPGLSASLPGFERVIGPILRTPEEGIDTITWLATAPRARYRAWPTLPRSPAEAVRPGAVDAPARDRACGALGRGRPPHRRRGSRAGLTLPLRLARGQPERSDPPSDRSRRSPGRRTAPDRSRDLRRAGSARAACGRGADRGRPSPGR